MEECELCGKKTDSATVVIIEDVEFRVCDRCADGKKVVSKPRQRAQQLQQRRTGDEQEEILIANYGEAIRKGREKMDLPLKVVAEMLNEKYSLLRRIEEQQARPPTELCKKLERLLGIKLTENAKDYEDKGSAQQQKAGGKPTIGDFLGDGK
jgi:uncharacterized protein (TIGR00270 family)